MSERAKEALTKRFWGRMGALELPMRITALVFVMVTIAAMSFCQLGFWSIGVVDGKPVYLLLLLGPLVMGAFMYGPITGALLGLYTAVIVSLHAMAIPLDYYEVYFMTPFNTFVLITAIGALSGLLFDLALHRNPEGIAKFALIALVCIVVSFAASGLMMLGMLVDYGGPDNLDFISEYFSTALWA